MLTLTTVPWPLLQDHAQTFMVAKGLLALVATVLVVVHMSLTWDDVATWSQRLRYLSLLALIGLVAFASPEQVGEGIPVSWRHVGGAGATLLVIVAMVVSIRQDLRSKD
jgi:Na+/citrate or Na+/malate symporter